MWEEQTFGMPPGTGATYMGEHRRWYTCWHTPKPIEWWHCTMPWQWQFIGWEKWSNEGKRESQFVVPNPALMTNYNRKAPKTGLQCTTYNEDGEVIRTWAVPNQAWRPWHHENKFQNGGTKGEASVAT